MHLCSAKTEQHLFVCQNQPCAVSSNDAACWEWCERSQRSSGRLFSSQTSRTPLSLRFSVELLRSQRHVAMISEMIHTASLVHDDVVDTSETRRGKPSAQAAWGQRKVGAGTTGGTVDISMVVHWMVNSNTFCTFSSGYSRGQLHSVHLVSDARANQERRGGGGSLTGARRSRARRVHAARLARKRKRTLCALSQENLQENCQPHCQRLQSCTCQLFFCIVPSLSFETCCGQSE